MKKSILYKYYLDCGRMGGIEGIFVSDKKTVTNALGKQLHFGDALGKHSDIGGVLDNEDLTVLTDDQEFIKKFKELECENGYNPLDYLVE